MEDRQKITVIVPTFNEEKNIKECLESLEWADEIFIVDSFSKDKSRGITRIVSFNMNM
jgi:glycosyltransferase involved in cell wall biosynthesis